MPIANFCRSANAYGVVGYDDETPVVYDIVSSTDGGAFVFTVSRWTAEVGVVPAPTTIAAVIVEAAPAWGTAHPFASEYVAVDRNETALLFGYSVFTDDVPGELFRVDVESGAITRLQAPGNFDAAWLDNDNFVVSGLGLGALSNGQGLYAFKASEDATVHVGTHLGVYGGSVGITSEYLIAGGSDADFSPLIFSISRASFDAALTSGTPVDLMASGHPVAIPSSAFSVWPDGRRLTVAEYMGPIRAWSVAPSNGSLSISSEENLASDTFTDAFFAGSSRVMLRHASGLLLARAK